MVEGKYDDVPWPCRRDAEGREKWRIALGILGRTFLQAASTVGSERLPQEVARDVFTPSNADTPMERKKRKKREPKGK